VEVSSNALKEYLERLMKTERDIVDLRGMQVKERMQ
jgi:hypothetical protein